MAWCRDGDRSSGLVQTTAGLVDPVLRPRAGDTLRTGPQSPWSRAPHEESQGRVRPPPVIVLGACLPARRSTRAVTSAGAGTRFIGTADDAVVGAGCEDAAPRGRWHPGGVEGRSGDALSGAADTARGRAAAADRGTARAHRGRRWRTHGLRC